MTFFTLDKGWNPTPNTWTLRNAAAWFLHRTLEYLPRIRKKKWPGDVTAGSTPGEASWGSVTRNRGARVIRNAGKGLPLTILFVSSLLPVDHPVHLFSVDQVVLYLYGVYEFFLFSHKISLSWDIFPAVSLSLSFSMYLPACESTSPYLQVHKNMWA